MGRIVTFLSNVGIGAGLMYFLDPSRGRRRRSLVRDKGTHYLSSIDDAIDTTSRDLNHRAHGLVARATSLLDFGKVPEDDVLVARVRSKMGRYVSHPSAIEVMVDQGRVRLSGPILAPEVEALISAVNSVPGVLAVENCLEGHETTEDIPALQGRGNRTGEQIDLLQSNWSPTSRVLAGTVGGILTLNGLRRRGFLGTLMGFGGFTLLGRAITNLDTERLMGVGGGRRAIDFHKTVTIDAPVERVYDFWSDFEKFPLFMSHVREVQVTDDGSRSHWAIAGPAGVSVEFDAVITKMEPNKVLAWKSVPGSTVGHTGIIRFDPVENDMTRLDIQMSYNPPAGALGHVVASLFGVDPMSSMNDDLIRFKSLIEYGKTTAKGETITLDEVDDKISRHRHLRRVA